MKTIINLTAYSILFIIGFAVLSITNFYSINSIEYYFFAILGLILMFFAVMLWLYWLEDYWRQKEQGKISVYPNPKASNKP